MTIPIGTRGHVVGLGYRVAAEVVEVAPASIKVQWQTPDSVWCLGWFSTTPGARYLRRHGDTTEHALRFEVGE